MRVSGRRTTAGITWRLVRRSSASYGFNMTAPITHRDLVSARSVIIIACILAVLMIAGSVLDYAISQSLYAPSNRFGVLLAAYGATPAFLAWTASGTVLIRHRPRERRARGVVILILGILLVALGTVLTCIIPLQYIPDATSAVVIGVGIGISAATIAIIWHASGGAERRVAIRVAVVLALVPAIELVLVNAIKLLWERPRMRMLDSTPHADFMPWWMPGYDERASLIATGIVGDDFKSFPSAHTSNAAVAMMLTATAALSRPLRPHAELLLWIGFGWAVIVGASRVVIGAHFVTDVAVGLAITFAVMLIAYRYAFPRTTASDEPDKPARPNAP